MIKVISNITQNFRGKQLRRGDAFEITKEELKLFDGTGSDGMPHIIIRNQTGAKGKGRKAKTSD